MLHHNLGSFHGSVGDVGNFGGFPHGNGTMGQMAYRGFLLCFYISMLKEMSPFRHGNSPLARVKMPSVEIGTPHITKGITVYAGEISHSWLNAQLLAGNVTVPSIQYL